MVEGGPGDAPDLGDGSLGDLLLQEHPDFLLLAIKLGRSQRPFGAAEQATLGSDGGKPFLLSAGLKCLAYKITRIWVVPGSLE
jgi:hypothetical protein